MKVLNKVNFSLKETINSESATTVLKSLAGTVLKVTGFLIAEKEDVDEETKEISTIKIGVLKTAEGQLVSSISTTVINSIDSIINAYTDANMIGEIETNGIDIKVCSSKSGKNREFFYLELV